MLAAAETPRVSVVMPVHNAMPYLDIAVESILGQTLQNFEFVILDDASTDGSTERLRDWAARDPRIRLIEEAHNLGPARSSQRVAVAATAPVVARMDADDVSYPRRLEEQLQVLDSYPGVGVVGGLYDIIDASGRKIRGPEAWRLVHPASVPPFGNGPLMYRREVFDQAGGYRKQCEFWEDHDLIIRMGSVSKIMIVPHAVYQVRQSPVSTRFASEQSRVERALDLMYRCRERLEQHRGYDDLLDARVADHARIDPRAFISTGSMALWSGGKPRLFRRLLRRGDLRLNARTLGALVWTAWASVEPRSLRAFIRTLLLGRRLRASFAVKTTGPVTWTAPILPRDATADTRPEAAQHPRHSMAIHEARTTQPARVTRVAAE
ncbi:MAG: glycosyltransferase family 2 protein [Sphingomonas sp.]|nr:glycosyltransferase family 2 protein [Sphingomonas sp.]